VLVEPDLGSASCPDLATVLDEVNRALRAGPRDSGWVVARGFDEALVAERRLPRRRELDAACPGSPLRLRHRTGHASLLNTAAFDRLPAPPVTARVEPDDDGLPVLLVGAEAWLTGVVGRPRRVALIAGLREAETMLSGVGIARVWDATPRNLAEIDEFLGLLEDAAFSLAVRWMNTHDAVPKTVGEDWTTVKLFPDQCPAELESRVESAHRSGARVAIHATDESEIEIALGALERHRADGITDRIEHATLLSAEQARRIAALQAVIVTHPGWLVTRRRKYDDQLTAAQRRILIPLRTALACGCRIAFASDAPVERPDPTQWINAATDPSRSESVDLAAAWDAACGGPLWGVPDAAVGRR
jgi:predicted amidohydrolase YtcJ